jgi:hypothetical protein
MITIIASSSSSRRALGSFSTLLTSATRPCQIHLKFPHSKGYLTARIYRRKKLMNLLGKVGSAFIFQYFFRTYYQFSDKFALILIRDFIELPNFHRLHCTGEEHGCRQERSR